MISINLIPAERIARKRRHKRLRVWTGICCAYALALLAAVGAGYSAWGANDPRSGDQLKAAEEKTGNSDSTIRELQQTLIEAKASLRVSKAISNRPDWSSLLVLIAEELENKIVLDCCKLVELDNIPPRNETEPGNLSGPSTDNKSLRQKQFKLILTGLGRTQTDVSQFILRLEQVEVFDEVKLTQSVRQAFLTGEVISFRIECGIGAKYYYEAITFDKMDVPAH